MKMRNAYTEEIIDLKPERVEVLSYVSPREKKVMLAVALLLAITTMLLSHREVELRQPKPLLNEIFIEKHRTTDADIRSIQLGGHIPVKGHLRASMNDTLASLQATMDETSKTMEKQKAIHNAEAALYKTHLGDTSISDAERRRLLLKAGLTPSKREDTPPLIKEKHNVDGLELSHSIAKELIRDEVEGFILKIKLATRIGEYLFED